MFARASPEPGAKSRINLGVANLLLSVLLIAAPAGKVIAGVRIETKGSEEKVLAGCIARSAGGRDWLEKTLWGLRDQEGGWIGAEIANSDGSHDLGPMQVNSRWVDRIAKATRRPSHQVRQWLANDACFNVDVARWIFLSALRQKRDYWRAVGVYHSPTGWRQQRYAVNVARRLSNRFGALVFLTDNKPRVHSQQPTSIPR